jgi:hypothetical protein
MRSKIVILTTAIIVSLFTSLSLNAQSQYASPEDSIKAIESQVINSKYGKTYGDSVECVKNLSLYREYYKQWQNSEFENEEMLKAAYPSWRANCDICPKVSLNLYFRGARMLKHIIDNTEDSLTKQAYVDSLMMLYDQRIEHFGDHPTYGKASALGFKAMDLYKLRNDNPEEFYPIFLEAYKVGGHNTSAATLQGLFNTSVMMAKKDSIPWSEVIYKYLDIKETVNFNLTRSDIDAGDSARYESAGNHLDKLMVAIATCENIVRIFTPQYVKDSTNVNLLRAIIRLSDIRDCTDHDLYYKSATQLHRIEPSPLSALSLGKLNMKKDDYAAAEPYLKEAAETFPDSLKKEKSESYLLYAECLRGQKKYSSSRSAASSSLEYNPDEARAYIIIGDIYAANASECEFKGLKTTYWLAYDEYSKAFSKANQVNIKDAARQKMAVMKSNFPTAEEIFMRSLKIDQSFTVECWINRTTTIRAR